MLGFLGVHARSVVGHGDHRTRFIVVDADPCGRPRGGVGPDVAEQVVDDLTEAGGVSHHLDGPGGLEGHRPLGADGGCCLHRFGTQGHQVYRLLLHGSALIEAGQQQEVGDQVLHARRLVANSAHQALEILLLLGRTPTEELGVGRYGRDRCA